MLIQCWLDSGGVRRGKLPPAKLLLIQFELAAGTHVADEGATLVQRSLDPVRRRLTIDEFAVQILPELTRSGQARARRALGPRSPPGPRSDAGPGGDGGRGPAQTRDPASHPSGARVTGPARAPSRR